MTGIAPAADTAQWWSERYVAMKARALAAEADARQARQQKEYFRVCWEEAEAKLAEVEGYPGIAHDFEQAKLAREAAEAELAEARALLAATGTHGACVCPTCGRSWYGQDGEPCPFCALAAAREACPPERLIVLANWFDVYDAGRGFFGDRRVQRDLRALAAALTAATEPPVATISVGGESNGAAMRRLRCASHEFPSQSDGSTDSIAQANDRALADWQPDSEQREATGAPELSPDADFTLRELSATPDGWRASFSVPCPPSARKSAPCITRCIRTPVEPPDASEATGGKP